ncbi:GrpB family protein [Viridibacillus sp. YIM B01967]|uniref:GrpB family protein n=1 Tax=Viridibacillus soli TaxID=2798301 RepID=A0ABS1HAW3_9BACL|nr:GrpB family protein [Viridibacillus soli]MBK3496541.1 GrpB family protein [Viridibacillus soli]
MKVRLTNYQEHWQEEFEKEATFLKSILKNIEIQFEHFGSTAVKGMKAKPVIDMIGIVKCIDDLEPFNDILLANGYDVAGEWGINGRRLYRKGGENRTHHIHMYQFDNPHIERHLVVRDYLRTHPLEVDGYNHVKTVLTSEYDDTREYSKAKKDYVNELEKRAYKWFLHKD